MSWKPHLQAITVSTNSVTGKFLASVRSDRMSMGWVEITPIDSFHLFAEPQRRFRATSDNTLTGEVLAPISVSFLVFTPQTDSQCEPLFLWDLPPFDGCKGSPWERFGVFATPSCPNEELKRSARPPFNNDPSDLLYNSRGLREWRVDLFNNFIPDNISRINWG